MNADEIVRALRWLAKETEFIFTAENLNGAAALIESLQAQLADLAQLTHSKSEQLSECQQNNDKLQSKLADAKRRERAAVEDLNTHGGFGACLCCKKRADMVHHCDCFESDGDDKCVNFEWRGPQGKGGTA